ncbi:progesterone receptor [Sardina pilchardus]|uniref:progesterone receptor n=1 Tax=Sardina pilchardus TaxID=27697 RepID=UPI002E14FC4B
MERINSSVLDSSTGKRVNDFLEKYPDAGSDHATDCKETMVCFPTGMSSFANVATLCTEPESISDSVALKGMSDKVFNKKYSDRADDYIKSEHDPWIPTGEFQMKQSVSPESSQSSSASIASQGDTSKFIKDEREPSLIMDPDFGLTSNVSAMNSCYNGKKQQFDFMVEVPSFPSHSTGQQASQQHLFMCKNEMSRWPLQSSTADSQVWCQPMGMTEEQHHQSAYSSADGINTGFLQRSSNTYSTYSGMPPQRACVICGDEASGCHYGVVTCGSCKVFFKRAVEGHHNYLCAGRNDCIVDKIRRKNCPACRLRKCYQAGMMLGGRKLKRFGAMKAMGLPSSLMFHSPLTITGDGQTMTTLPCMPSLRELQLSPQIISILDSIEPEVVYSGYDNAQPDMPNQLLNCLNRLCERQLLWIVRWSKSLPGFRSLHISDQMTLIQYSWMNLMVFSLGWRTFQNVSSEYLYFAPDLILNQERMRKSPIYDLCLAMQVIPQEFANLQVTREEFLCMKALMLLNTVPLEGLKSQNQFDEMRQNYIRELTKAIHIKEKGLVASSQRFYQLTKVMDAMHEIVKKVNLYCLSTFIQADAMKVEFPEMMSEVIASQLPKVLAGMVKPLLFHNK